MQVVGFLGKSLRGWLGKAYGWHLCKSVDQVIQFNWEALQTFFYFPREVEKKRQWETFPLSVGFTYNWVPYIYQICLWEGEMKIYKT